MTEEQTIIDKISQTNTFSHVVDLNNWEKEFDALIKKIHPDKCSLDGAKEATAKLLQLRNEHKNGKEYTDESGTFKTNGFSATFTGDETLLKTSFTNYNYLKTFKDKNSLHFHQYMPASMKFENGKLEVQLDKRAVPLSSLTLPQEHVNWILNRMLEFSAWLAQINYVHCGFNPESVFIIPENHGIQVCSFYHLTGLNLRAKTIAGKYEMWYPAELFQTKEASSLIDIELAKRTAIYVLGDKSGNGVKLRKTHNEKFIDFALTQHTNAYDTAGMYRQFLNDNFVKQFHELHI